MQFNLHRHSCIFRVTKCWDKAKASIPYVLHRDEETAALCRAPSELEAQTGFPGASVNVLRKASSPCVPSSHLLTSGCGAFDFFLLSSLSQQTCTGEG